MFLFLKDVSLANSDILINCSVFLINIFTPRAMFLFVFSVVLIFVKLLQRGVF